MENEMMQLAANTVATSVGDIEAAVLGLVQGLTEYLPVSSSGHLAIASKLFEELTEYLPVSSSGHLAIASKLFDGVKDVDEGTQMLGFTVLLHIATVLSTLVVLRKEIWQLVRGLFGCTTTDFLACGEPSGQQSWLTPERRYIACIVLSAIPIAIVGMGFKDKVEKLFYGKMWIVGACLLLTAALLAFSHISKPRERKKITFTDAIVMGIAQAVAVLPGLSRSGSTIGTGLILGVSKEKLAQFSFLMVIPPILGEAALSLLKIVKGEAAFGDLSTSAIVIGFLTAFISGCIACKVMIQLVKRSKMIWFAAYCALAGVATLLFLS